MQLSHASKRKINEPSKPVHLTLQLNYYVSYSDAWADMMNGRHCCNKILMYVKHIWKQRLA